MKPTPEAPLPADDHALFEAAVGPVRRLQAEEPISTPRPGAQPRQRLADEQAALSTAQYDPFAVGGPGDGSRYRRHEVGPATLQRLSRGLYAVQDEFDLHGFDARSATDALRRFLAECLQRRLRCVRIIHGKGGREPGQVAVLRPLVEHLLRQRNDVLAYASAPAPQGGNGALLVLLVSRRQPPAAG